MDRLSGDARKLLSENLLPGETVKAVIPGTWSTAMIATDRRVFVFKKGVFGGVALGKKLASWDYATLNGIQIETGVVGGVVALNAPGVSSQDISYWGNGKNSPQSSPHALAIGRADFDQARRGVAIIREMIATSHAPQTATVQAASPTVADQLRQFADLLESGIITQEEFAAQKASLLGMPAPEAFTSCPRCGHRNQPNDRFCASCGAALS